MEVISINGIQYKKSPNAIFLIKIIEDKYIYIKKDKLQQVITSNPDLFRLFKIIENEVLFLIKDSNSIYIKFGVDDNIKNNITLRSEDYDDDLRNDCLVYAEKLCVLHKTKNDFEKYKEFTGKKAKVAFKEKDTKLQFGGNNANNFKVTLKKKSQIRSYYNINPNIGEAYILSRMLYNHPDNYELLNDNEKEGCPYHAACVILKDENNCNITLEADRSDKNRNMPVFDMYYVANNNKTISTKLADFTFYKRFQNLYTVNDNLNFIYPKLKNEKSQEKSRRLKILNPVLFCVYVDDTVIEQSNKQRESCNRCTRSSLRNKKNKTYIVRKIGVKSLTNKIKSNSSKTRKKQAKSI